MLILVMGGLEFTLNWMTNLLIIIVISEPNTSVNKTLTNQLP